jgi:formate dehydrogenase
MGAWSGAALSLSRPVIPIAPEASTRQRKRAAPKGRRVDPEALAQVQALLGASRASVTC